ncbi:MAG: hypothetical protein EA397_16180 [Deltaproteobacteria bacterium]|nr:MAG: hypothetical protein EA397_16180 [Deltaproteobacteria bacterium]
MIRSVLIVAGALLATTGCEAGFTGTDGFTVGRAQLIPCRDPAGEPGALLVIESRTECWNSFPGERPGCADRRRILGENPGYCSPNLVIDSPSRSNLTTFLGPPIDVNDYRGAGSVTVLNLPCNPGGPFAEGYPDFQQYIQTFQGEVLVTDDNGDFGRVELDLHRVGSDEPAIVGSSRIAICRP